MRRLLITGSSGMLGSNLIYELGSNYELYGIDNSTANPELQKQFQIDMRDSAKLGEVFSVIRPDFVVHCAALTDVDMCEDNYVSARETNALATKHLVSLVGSETRFIYISTDSVFDGKRGNYSETDLPCPLNNYAKTKLEGEWFVEQGLSNYVIIRTNLYGWNRVKGRAFAEWVYQSLEQKKCIKMFTDVIFSPISVYTLSSYIEKLLNLDFVGRLNIGTKDPISKYDFGVKLAKLFGLDASLITPVSVETFNFKAPRPKNTSLAVSIAEKILDSLPNIEDELFRLYEHGDKKS
jgi:dTDP-4-dehydrorhamnose reductase